MYAKTVLHINSKAVQKTYRKIKHGFFSAKYLFICSGFSNNVFYTITTMIVTLMIVVKKE